MRKFLSIDIQTRLTDYDPFGHLNNVSYVNFLEVARLEGFSRHLNLDLTRTSALTAKTEIEYIRPAPFGVELTVKMGVKAVGNKSSTMAFEVVDRGDHSVVFARATIAQVTIDMKTGKTCPLPEHVRAGMMELMPEDDAAAA